MLRISFKNEENEMLSRTINELQELRAELSVLKEKLIMIIPEDQAFSVDEVAADMEIKQADDDNCSDAEEFFNGEEIYISDGDGYFIEGEDDSSAGGSYLYGEADDSDEEVIECEMLEYNQSQCGLPECDKSECETQECDAIEGEGIVYPDENEESVSKDWAVVNYEGIKRPWWKFRFLFSG